jgi:hypothetical protein
MFRTPPWSLSVALAATLVLAFTVILHTAKQPVRVAADVAVQTVARSVDAAPEGAGAAASPAAAAASSAAAPAAPPARRSENYASNATQADTAMANEAIVDLAAARASSAPAEASRGLVSEAEAKRYAEPPPAGPALARSAAADETPGMETRARVDGASAPALAKSSAETPWRRDSKTWLAEIERLRASGDVMRADAELAEFQRQHRAYATDPNR